MLNFFNPFFLPLTIISLAICACGLIYLFMGVSQFATGYIEKDRRKKKGGLTALIISILIMAFVIYSYFAWIWV